MMFPKVDNMNVRDDLWFSYVIETKIFTCNENLLYLLPNKSFVVKEHNLFV